MTIKRISQSLSCATCALLGTGNAVAEPWEIDIGLMNYIEEDRNTGLELLIDGTRELSGGDSFTFGLQLGTFSGRQAVLTGGPVLNTGRLVFAPGMNKHVYFRELQALAETFSVD